MNIVNKLLKIICVIYIDDSIIFGGEKLELPKDLALTQLLYAVTGFWPSSEKVEAMVSWNEKLKDWDFTGVIKVLGLNYSRISNTQFNIAAPYDKYVKTI